MNFDYDEEVDVLYISFDNPKPSYGKDVVLGGAWIVGMFDVETDELNGATIIGFKKWIEKSVEGLL